MPKYKRRELAAGTHIFERRVTWTRRNGKQKQSIDNDLRLHIVPFLQCKSQPFIVQRTNFIVKKTASNDNITRPQSDERNSRQFFFLTNGVG